MTRFVSLNTIFCVAFSYRPHRRGKKAFAACHKAGRACHGWLMESAEVKICWTLLAVDSCPNRQIEAGPSAAALKLSSFPSSLRSRCAAAMSDSEHADVVVLPAEVSKREITQGT